MMLIGRVATDPGSGSESTVTVQKSRAEKILKRNWQRKRKEPDEDLININLKSLPLISIKNNIPLLIV